MAEDSADTLEPTRRPLDLVAPPVHRILSPQLDPLGIGKHERRAPAVERELLSSAALVYATNHQEAVDRQFQESAQQRARLRRTARPAKRNPRRYGQRAVAATIRTLATSPIRTLPPLSSSSKLLEMHGTPTV